VYVNEVGRFVRAQASCIAARSIRTVGSPRAGSLTVGARPNRARYVLDRSSRNGEQRLSWQVALGDAV
jgi:hypothetical protein